MILEAIYEGSFDMNSHGFRPKRSCHTALRQIQRTFNGARWFIEGDIKGFFDNIDHGVMISILEKRISDERFLRLIRKFLNAGYLEDWTYHKTYSGTPQGGIISPMLANIYLDQLDRYVREYIQRFDKGKERADNPERIKFEYGKRLAVLKLEKVKDKEQRKFIVKEIKAYDKGRAAISCGVDMDENFRRLKYVRYADDFLCAVIGTKAEAETIKQDIKVFLQEKLALELSEEKKLSTLLLIAAVAAGIDANSAEVTRIAAGDHTMLLTKDGKIYVSGKNDAGQLGDGHYYDSEVSDNHYNATTFKPVEKDGVKFRSVTATLYNSYAIASDGALYAWGQNAYGQLGLVSVGTYSGIYTPTKVDDAKWAVVKGRSTTIVGIHTDGTLWAWGKNLTGQLGIGADSEMKECAMAPEKVSDERWLDCASGYYHSTAVKADGTLWAWGDNSQNQVNSSTTAIFTTPQQVGEDTDWTQVQAGLKMSAALKADGTLWTWGNNEESALGRAVEGKTDGKPMKAFDKVLSYSVGDMHVLVIKDDYTLWGWGYNLHGELANGTNRNIDTPTQIGTAQWQTVAAGFYHSVGVQIDGSVWSWGFNRYGQLGLGDDNNRSELSKVDFNPEEGAVAEIATDSAVKVYPTVAEETITVSSDATISSVSIYNANGQKVGFKMVDGTQTSLNVSHLAAGTYFVATESGAGKSVARFIKK